MPRQIVPIAQRARRIPEAGRIRIGELVPTRNGRSRPSSRPDFRFTSHDEQALRQIADMYGGQVKPWTHDKAAGGQYEVCTTATEIRVILPPEPLGETPIYELWGGGGCERRCDGVTAGILQQGPDGLEPADAPCLCRAKGVAECKITTHLSVILPEVRFAGVWRLTTHSENAAAELPGMVELIQGLQGQGLAYAVLGIRQRRSVVVGETKLYNVPVLGVPESIEQLQSGALRLGSLSTGEAPAALGTGSTGGAEAPSLPAADPTPQPAPPAPAVPRDEPVEAESVDERPPGFVRTEPDPDAPPPVVPADPMTDAQSRALHALLRRKKAAAGPDRFAVLAQLLDREVTSTKELSRADAGHCIDQLNNEPDAS